MKRAFTLAEVLITLAIIGVVAAMTIPTLVQDYQKKVFETAFKTNRAKLAQVVKLMMAQEGADSLLMTRFFVNCAGQDMSCELSNPDLRNYMKATKYTKNIEYTTLGGLSVSEVGFSTGDCSDDGANCYQTVDGTIISIYTARTKPFSVGGEPFLRVAIDTNGEKGPNQLGRDWFAFKVNNSGTVFGQGELGMPTSDFDHALEGAHWSVTCNSNFSMSTKDFYILQGGTEEEFESEWNAMTEEERVEADAYVQQQIAESKPMLEMGYGCAGRLIEKGKMDY